MLGNVRVNLGNSYCIKAIAIYVIDCRKMGVGRRERKREKSSQKADS